MTKVEYVAAIMVLSVGLASCVYGLIFLVTMILRGRDAGSNS